MTIELALCLLLMLVALPVSLEITIHYLVFSAVNAAFLGIAYADSSLLAMTFGAMALLDICLFLVSRRYVLLVSGIAMLALSCESIGNGDWLLNNSTYLSVATNALIVGSLIKEYVAWMRGRLEH
jgi:hypothetical protein